MHQRWPLPSRDLGVEVDDEIVAAGGIDIHSQNAGYLGKAIGVVGYIHGNNPPLSWEKIAL